MLWQIFFFLSCFILLKETIDTRKFQIPHLILTIVQHLCSNKRKHPVLMTFLSEILTSAFIDVMQYTATRGSSEHAKRLNKNLKSLKLRAEVMEVKSTEERKIQKVRTCFFEQIEVTYGVKTGSA